MKNRALLPFTVLYVCLLAQPVHGAEVIPSFDARIMVNEDASLEVTEQIVYDFGTTERHGIFRKIPYSYQAGTETYTANISSVLVTDEHGLPRPFQESRGNGELTLKIGDPNATVTGKHTYIISYIAEGPFLYFEDHDEVYWNVTGYWPQEIRRASVLVDLPRGASIITAACYQGQDGSKTPCTQDERLVSAERAGYTAVAEDLNPGEGLTVAVAFPKGIIAELAHPWDGPEPSRFPVFLPIALPIIVFAFMYDFWRKRGKDPKGKSTIVTEFSPPLGIGPALASVLDNERVSPNDISAEMVKLAVDGFIKIHKFEKKVLLFSSDDYLFERTGDVIPEDPIQSLVLTNIFKSKYKGTAKIQGEERHGALLSKMKNMFTEEKKTITDRVYDEAVVQYFFNEKPDKVRMRYILGGLAAAVFGFAAVIFFSDSIVGIFTGAAICLSSIIVALFGNWMPAKTQEGVRVREHLEGFKRYLRIAEKDRIKFHDSPGRSSEPERTVELFSRYLPFAMVYGFEKEWAKQFEGMFTEPPEWYGSTAGKAFTATAFMHDVKDFSTGMSSAMAPQSSGAGGGGSVGGGFGGGGGGSW